jgi:2-dehydro-3-deoxygalactonokinase
MVGSTEGWVRAPYCTCPAGLPDLARNLTAVPAASGAALRVIPGVDVLGATPDVMRGEETQIVGALVARPDLAADATLVLPGTHSKWVELRDARIRHFTTYLTGELFALLRDHSILGRPARGADGTKAAGAAAADWSAFDRGVAAARANAAGGLAPLLFRARALVLNGTLAAPHSLDFLSGLLVGDEVRCGLTAAGASLAVLGDPALCARYLRALAAFERPAVFIDATAPLGLWAIAERAGIVAGASIHG